MLLEPGALYDTLAKIPLSNTTQLSEIPHNGAPPGGSPGRAARSDQVLCYTSLSLSHTLLSYAAFQAQLLARKSQLKITTRDAVAAQTSHGKPCRYFTLRITSRCLFVSIYVYLFLFMSVYVYLCLYVCMEYTGTGVHG